MNSDYVQQLHNFGIENKAGRNLVQTRPNFYAMVDAMWRYRRLVMPQSIYNIHLYIAPPTIHLLDARCYAQNALAKVRDNI
jgi:hypothetical protein